LLTFGVAQLLHLTPPQYEAVWHEDIVLAKALLEQGARPDQYRNNIWGGTALMLAAQTGNLELVMLLLANGADLNATDLKGKTPIDWAQRRKHPEVLSVFRTFARGFAGARL
jgi:ankyrin repeat protein